MALISRKMVVQLGIKTDVDATGANLHILMLARNRPATRQFGWVDTQSPRSQRPGAKIRRWGSRRHLPLRSRDRRLPYGRVVFHPVEVRPGEVRPGEVRPGEVCPGESRQGEVRFSEVRATQVWNNIGVLLSPLIPCLRPFA